MAWSSSSSSQSPPGMNAVQPYRMHVSQKYLDLTRQKLELTRLPRDPRNPYAASDYGTSKSDIEPLIDHWVEEYDWRKQETLYNDALPQFRVAINGTRLHFVHKTSNSPMAVPLLFLHGWPESFISCAKVIDALCNPIMTPPKGNDAMQAFHVVVPSIPGYGFSDPVPEAANNLQATAEIFDALMKGLGYHRFMIHGSGWGFKIARVMALTHPESVTALHTVNPEVPPPRFGSSFFAWLRYRAAKLIFAILRRSSFGYTPEDVVGISSPMSELSMQAPGLSPPLTPGITTDAFERPQTNAYALCDSPAGLLAYMIDAIRPSPMSSPSGSQSPTNLRVPSNAPSPVSPQSYALSPQSSRTSNSPNSTSGSPFELSGISSPWTPTALISWAMLYWLPGPEVALRWLANSSVLLPTLWSSHSLIPLGITHFRESVTEPGCFQSPPQWAEAYHRIAMLRRREGRVRSPAWERPGEIVMDLREFADMLSTQMPMLHVTNGI